MTLIERLRFIDRCSTTDFETIHEAIGCLEVVRNALEPTCRHASPLGPREAAPLLQLLTSDVYTLVYGEGGHGDPA